MKNYFFFIFGIFTFFSLFAGEIEIQNFYFYSGAGEIKAAMQVKNTASKPIKGFYIITKQEGRMCDFWYATDKGNEINPGESRIVGGKGRSTTDGDWVYFNDKNPEYAKNLNNEIQKHELISAFVCFSNATNGAKQNTSKDIAINLYKNITSGVSYKKMSGSHNYEIDFLRYKFNHVIMSTKDDNGLDYLYVFANKDTAVGCPNYFREFLNHPENGLFELQLTFPAKISINSLLNAAKNKYGEFKETDFEEQLFFEINSDPTRGYQTYLRNVMTIIYPAYKFETDQHIVYIYGQSVPKTVSFAADDSYDKFANVMRNIKYQYWSQKSFSQDELQQLTKAALTKKMERCKMIITDKNRFNNIVNAAKKSELSQDYKEATIKELKQKKENADCQSALEL